MPKVHCTSHPPAAAACQLRHLSQSCTQVGAGYWLTDEALLRGRAEQLAKDQFAARRDPADAALQYMALGRRPLLQVLLHIPYIHIYMVCVVVAYVWYMLLCYMC